MKAVRLFSIGDFRVDQVETPIPKDSEILVKVKGCGVCGSDIDRIYVSGTSNQHYPMTLGHEIAGTVVAVGGKANANLVGQAGAIIPLLPCKTCDPCLVGKYNLCESYDYFGSRRDGGFAQYVLLPSDWNFVAANCDYFEALCLAEPTCVALHAVRRCGTVAGASIVIFGAGPIGLLAARWATLFGALDVVLVDVDEEKVAFCKQQGLIAVNSKHNDVKMFIRDTLHQKHVNFAIEGTGFADALEGCLRITKPTGKVVMLGNPHQDTVISKQAHSLILRKELNLAGVWNSDFSNFTMNEWKFAVRMLAEGKLNVTNLITHRVPAEQLAQLCKDIKTRNVKICKAICTFE